MSHFSAPGKLMIAGEWAVLEGSPCIVAAVNRRVHAVVEPGDTISINLADFALETKFFWNGNSLVAAGNYNAEKFKFTKEAVETALRFLEEKGIKPKPFRMRTYGEETNVAGKKVGFGSSAAAVVAIIASLLDFHGYKAAKEEIYKLAAIAHYYAQGKAGSAFDVAASTYGGIIVYRRFDAAWLTSRMESNERIAGIAKEEWPGLYVESLNIPENFLLAIAWTGESASTTLMMKQMASFKQTKPDRYVDIYDGIQHVVERIIGAWKSGDENHIMDGIRKNRELLRQLTDESGVGIETKELRDLAEIAERFGTAGKLSGAGGGDCGFVISFDKGIIENVKSELQKSGLHNIDAGIDKDGTRAV